MQCPVRAALMTGARAGSRTALRVTVSQPHPRYAGPLLHPPKRYSHSIINGTSKSLSRIKLFSVSGIYIVRSIVICI